LKSWLLADQTLLSLLTTVNSSSDIILRKLQPWWHEERVFIIFLWTIVLNLFTVKLG
jgi:hypothetical protein